ncbi:aldose 1-epimerase family protein [Pediococcus claussenii]|uniref:Galactose mutarotase related enzyme n=1 Tax=Pediococcus claussenii (strain ATCC BAA-344 / DSM 14800 / JCM 18046 / KCTC 3811 / LMG 21948 / P06) TaxID=701521 RepID=G8PD63_PEDCP|nr:aldose 1-epimerase family protein [Pediococcus claussenii]AEV95198.1 galactose mutarotase related enzyme [Pediococcus claussenii ATCC BAA-344]ANZ70429.1 galactose mutarotase [Pediococcus claussenii]ANZ72245.1 galactose mutarotase [Pediococcus claussenii]KRN19619.1 hypothetical protein IV79_GL001336 [Pediococcus claussenii]
MISLQNEYLAIQINEDGAELVSVKSADGIEYVWQADSNIWGRHAPVLFPIVGRLKDDQYRTAGKTFSMGQHGFARDMTFSVISQDDTRVVLELRSSAETLLKYPFEFIFRVGYSLVEHEIHETYEVINPSNTEELLFSVGGHPGFNLNLGANIPFREYQLRVAPARNFDRVSLEAPLINLNDLQSLNLSKPLPLTHELFSDDALILELKNKQTTFMLENSVNDHGVALTVDNAPYLGVWSPYPVEGPFVCLEPWWGIADTNDATGELKHKLAINKVASTDNFKREFEITFF